MTRMPLSLRRMDAGDRPFVAATLHKSIADCPCYRPLPILPMRRLLVARSTEWLAEWPCMVACADDDDDLLLGFVIGRAYAGAAEILYLYVKENYRRHGIGRALVHHVARIESPSILALHWSQVCEPIALAGYPLYYVPSRLGDPARLSSRRT